MQRKIPGVIQGLIIRWLLEITLVVLDLFIELINICINFIVSKLGSSYSNSFLNCSLVNVLMLYYS